MDLLTEIESLRFPVTLPTRLLELRQSFNATCLDDVVGSTRQALEEGGLLLRIAPGDRVAVGVGSRGIANLSQIVRTVIDCLKAHGANPFIIPAMGSHGGATPEGQRTMLAELGVTEETSGAEIRATMEVVEVGRIEGGPLFYQDRYSAEADHTLLINRVKPHTDFRSDLESGLTKMAVIGLGKQRGAEEMHSWGAPGFRQFLAPAARVYEERTNLLGGLAIVENAYDETAEIVALSAAELGREKEQQLLARANSLMASLPFPEIDVLVVRKLGKNISGTGMDTNIIGRLMIPREPENFGGPDVAVITVLDLTDETHGNAAGIGLANVTTRRLVEKIDWIATYTNAVTSGIFGMQRVSLPITMADDRRALEVAVRGCGQPRDQARIVFIDDTLTLDRLWVSPGLHEQVEAHPRLSTVREVPLIFSPDGAMVRPWSLD